MLIVSDKTQDRERLEKVQAIKRSGQHLLTLINDVLDLSKIEAQKIEVDMRSVSILDVLSGIDESFSVLAKDKNINFRIDIDYPIPESIQTDPTRLKQILINLCGNAVKFTEQGSVTLDIRCSADSDIIFFNVKDTGIGLTPEGVARLFGLYEQVGGAASGSGEGTGLGLYLSKQLAQHLGGDITVESEYGRGSTFTLMLSMGVSDDTHWIDSATKASPAVISSGEQSAELIALLAKTPSLSALVVDDDENSIEIVSSFLGVYIDDICKAADGEQALEAIKQKKTDLIIIDYNLPKLNGADAIKAIRADSENSEAKILCVTGSTVQADIDAIYSAGADLYLVKPITSGSFTDGLCRLFGLAGHEGIENSTSEVSAEKHIDLEKMDERFAGNRVLTIKTISNFVEKYGDAQEYLSEVLDQDDIDYESFYLYVHNLANNADLLFVGGLTMILREIEQLINAEDVDAIKTLIAEKELYHALGLLIEESRRLSC